MNVKDKRYDAVPKRYNSGIDNTMNVKDKRYDAVPKRYNSGIDNTMSECKGQKI